MKKHRTDVGFSLIEVIVAVSILVILAGIAIPVVSKQVEKAKSGNILTLADTLRSACERYKSDTGEYATEYSEKSYTASKYHQLSLKQTSPTGWDGPYIDHPLTRGDNPYDGECYMYANLTGGSIKPNGFDLTGSGTVTHTGDGNFIGFAGIPESVAEKVDKAFDESVPGNWKTTGRVEYSSGKLAIYVCGGIN